MRLLDRNPLDFPAGMTPGFNPNHLFSSGIAGAGNSSVPGALLSVVSTGNNFFNVLTGQSGALVNEGNGASAPVSRIDSYMGLATSSPGQCSTFPTVAWSSPPAPYPSVTFACVYNPLSLTASFDGLLSISATSGGGGIWISRIKFSNKFGIDTTGGGASTTFTFAANTPYFCAVSSVIGGTNNAKFLIINLKTGQVTQESVSWSSTLGGTDGLFGVGAVGSSGANTGALSHGFISSAYVDLNGPAGDIIAAAPWELWYPSTLDQQQDEDVVGVVVAAGAPFNQDDWSLPVQPPRLDQSWTWQQTRMLGQDRLPNRQQDWPLPTPSPRLDQTWTWAQTDMIGQDRLPFRQQDWPLSIPPPPGATWTWRQTGMLGQDRLPFRQQDWPNPAPLPVPGAIWTWRQTGMFGQDQLPFRQQDWPLPVLPPRLDETWIQGFSNLLSAIIVLYPKNQYDWPLPVQPPRLDQTWAWSQTDMIGQDRLPFRQQDWPLPVPPALPGATWTWRQTGMFGQDKLPFRQQDWPLPTPPAPGTTWTWQQTGMFGQDQLPFRQQDWPLSTQPSRLDATWAQGSTLLLSQVVILYPKNQYDWPLPTPPPRLDQSWTWRQVGMAGQDRLPFRQQDWPLPTPPTRLDQTFAWRQTGMFGQDRMPAGGRTFFALPPHPIKWIDLTWNFGPYVPAPPPPLITVVYSKQFFSQIGSIMGIPGDPPS